MNALSKKETLEAVTRHVIDSVRESGVTAEVVAFHQRNLDNHQVNLLVFGKYYYRMGSYATLTVMLIDNDNNITADVVGFGDETRTMIADYGAGADFAKVAMNALEKIGFEFD